MYWLQKGVYCYKYDLYWLVPKVIHQKNYSGQCILDAECKLLGLMLAVFLSW